MKKLCLIFILFLSSIIPANAINEPIPTDFNSWYSQSTPVYFNTDATSKMSHHIYNDEYLKEYLAKAFTANYSLKIAKDRILQYQNLAKEVNSARLPFVSLSPNANTQRNMSTSSGNYTSTGFYNLPVQLNWELDIWGKNSLKYQSSKLDVYAREQELNMTKLSVINDLSVSYFNLIVTDYLIQNTQHRVSNLEQTIKLKESLYKNGIISYDDIYLTKYEYSQTIEELNQYQIQYGIFTHQIYVLMGEVPKENLPHSEISNLKIPQSMELNNAELLMFTRPDVLMAKSELDKAHIDVKVAQREFLPSVYLNELIGLSTLSFSDLFNWYSRIYQFGGQVVADLYTGGYKKANLNYNRQVLQEKMHNYYSVLLNSIKETQDILTTLDNDYKSYLEYKKILGDSIEYKKITLSRFNSGISSRIDYLDAERQVYINSKYLNIYTSKVLVDLANLNKSLGRVEI